MSTELEVVGKALVDIDAVAAGIAKLTETYGGVVFDVATSKGMDDAKAARLAIREPRYSVERIRRDAKRPLLDLGKKLDAEAARIERELLKIEEPIQAQIAAEEKRKEQEREARIAAEQRRIADLQARVAELRGCRTLSVLSRSELIADHIGDVERLPVDDSFQEYRQQAEDAKLAGLAWLRELHAAAVAHESEQARIKAERAELARLREQQAVRDAEARRQREEEERQATVQRAKERVEHEAQLGAQREETERVARERQAALDIERQRLADERAEFDRQLAQAQQSRDEAERTQAELSRIALIKRPSEAELIEAVSGHFRVPALKALQWLRAYNWKKWQAA